LLVSWCLGSRRSAAETSPDLEELAPVGHLANASNTVAAKVDSLGLILPHLVVANLSHGLGWLASIAFPLSFTLG